MTGQGHSRYEIRRGESYDQSDDCKKSYDAAVLAKRAKLLNAKKIVHIGDCTLYLGDCLEIVPGIGPIDAVVSDPPYGIKFQSNFRRSKYDAISNDSSTEVLCWACELPVLHSAYIWMRWDVLSDVRKPKSLITWVKGKHTMGDLIGEHGRKTEVCAFYPGPDHFFPAGRPTDVIFGSSTNNKLHPTQKPTSVLSQQIQWTSGTVVDPFMGSGTTGVACVQLDRKFIGIELDEDYFEIACERIAKAYEQPRLFPAEKPKLPKTMDMFAEDSK